MIGSGVFAKTILATAISAYAVGSSGNTFTPAALFAQGEKGVWYDPADMSTMYQDSAGTTPVTALGQPVGLILDKSRGAESLPEKITNGDFSNGSTGWNTVNTASLSVTAGVLRVTNGAANYGQTGQVFSTVAGRIYRIKGTRVNSGGGATASTFHVGTTTNGTASDTSIKANGSATELANGFFFIATGSQTAVTLLVGGNTLGAWSEYDNISCVEFSGVPAYQSTPGSRPTLQARVNLGINTDGTGGSGSTAPTGWSVDQPFGGVSPTSWTSGVDATTGRGYAQARVVGTTTLSNQLLVAPSANFGARIPVVAGQQITVGYDFQISAGTYAYQLNLSVLWYDSGGSLLSASGGTARTPGSTYTRYTDTFTAPANAVSFYVRVTFPGYSTIGTAIDFTFRIGGIQYEYGSTYSTYQKVNTATDYVDIGAPRYLNFDGTDDFLVTPSIDFTGTSVLTSFAAVRKHPIGNGCIWASSTADSNGAGMMMGYINGASAGYWVSNGTNNGARALSSPYSLNPEVHSAVLTLGVAAASQVAARVNGSAASNASNPDAGSGNFQNLPIYIGRRNGSTLPLNGRIYGLVIRGATTDSGRINLVERFLGSRAGVSW